VLQIFIQVQSIGLLMEPAGETGRGDELDLLLDDVAVTPSARSQSSITRTAKMWRKLTRHRGNGGRSMLRARPSMTVRVSLQIS
jgi:hypothetical protein